MNFFTYLQTRSIYKSNGFSKEEKLLRNTFGYTSRKMTVKDPKELDDFLEEYYKKEPRRVDIDDLWANWVNKNISLLKTKKEKKWKIIKSFPNYLYEYDILPLSQALKRGIYSSEGELNVFRDPNFEPKYNLTIAGYKNMIRSRGLNISDYFPAWREEKFDIFDSTN